jgi:tetratricopeptide (TPR) repeat protein
MQKTFWRLLLCLMLLAIPAAVFAQESTQEAPQIPASYRLQGLRYEAQMWNNCGPATMTNALTYFGYVDNQRRAQAFLKPNIEDKNVSPWQMVDFVNSQVPELDVFGMLRYGGNLQLLKVLLANNFPVIIEQGYDPPSHDGGWMGHYLLLIGYDDGSQVFTSNDSYEGEGMNYSYAHIEEFWQHFNYTYIVLYEADREDELNAILGPDADEWTNAANAFNIAAEEATNDPSNAYAFFNAGTNLVHLAEIMRRQGNEAAAMEHYNNAATLFTQAQTLGMPWRILWYQFGPYEAYYAVAQASTDTNVATNLYAEILRLSQWTIDNCKNADGVCYVEESYYWAGKAREALGELDRALTNYNTALQINSNFTPAIEARDALLAAGS